MKSYPSIKSNPIDVFQTSSYEPARVFEKLVTKKQLAESLSISQSFINKLMVKDGLPYRQIGRVVRFSVSEVTEWLQTKRRP